MRIYTHIHMAKTKSILRKEKEENYEVGVILSEMEIRKWGEPLLGKSLPLGGPLKVQCMYKQGRKVGLS